MENPLRHSSVRSSHPRTRACTDQHTDTVQFICSFFFSIILPVPAHWRGGGKGDEGGVRTHTTNDVDLYHLTMREVSNGLKWIYRSIKLRWNVVIVKWRNATDDVHRPFCLFCHSALLVPRRGKVFIHRLTICFVEKIFHLKSACSSRPTRRPSENPIDRKYSVIDHLISFRVLAKFFFSFFYSSGSLASCLR